MNDLGFITVLPLLVMLVMVVATKRVFESMLVSLIFVFILKDGFGFIGGFIDGVYVTLAEETYPWVLLMLALFGAFISLLINSGGTNGFKRFATRYIKSQKSSLVFTWILGMILFIDDYINNLAIGPTVREITDQYKVPREGLGFIICSTGTPVCSLVPLTAFAVFVFGVMQDSGVVSPDSNMLTEYMKVVPFMFYPLMIILVVFLLVVGVIPKIGPFKRYYKELAESSDKNDILEANSVEVNDESENSSVGGDGKIIDFIVPIAFVLAVMLFTSDLVFSVIIGIAVCFVLYIPRKKMTIDKFFANFFEGINDMIYILIIILMTFIFVGALNELGFSDYVVETM